MTDFTTIVREARVVVTCGTGGVGKTTTAAATAMAAAAAGRRAAVVTIDPAKRLADALGIAELSNAPTVIDGPWPGTLGALMLDTKATFDDVVRHHAPTDEQAEAILASRFYDNIATSLGGTQDYMAVEKLAELSGSGDWDLVVVDTPPTRDALSFLEAPRLLTRLLDNPVYKLVINPSSGVLRAVNRAAQSVVRQLSRVVGAEVVDDAIAFFQSFHGMEDGFRQRADDTLALLHAPETAFVLVASPRADTITEADYFLDRLGAADLTVRSVIVNRMLPPLTTTPPRAEAIARAARSGVGGDAARALADHAAAAAGDEERVAELLTHAPGASLVRIPLLPSDVHDVDTLAHIATLLAS